MPSDRLADPTGSGQAVDLSPLRVALWCPDPLVDEALTRSLTSEGVDTILRPNSWDHLVTMLSQDRPDVLYALASPATMDQIANLFIGIRTGEIGDNPFLALDTITRYPQSPVLESMVDSGVDDILPYRWPQHYVHERLVHLALHRKKFVVTSTYVGPDRRRQPRQPEAGQPAPLFDVPNPVKAKAIDGLTSDDLYAQVEVARDQLLAERMGRLGMFLARCLLDVRESSLAPRDGMVAPISPDSKRAFHTARAILHLGQRLDGPTKWTVPSANASMQLAKLVKMMTQEGTEQPDVRPLHSAATSFLSRYEGIPASVLAS